MASIWRRSLFHSPRERPSRLWSRNREAKVADIAPQACGLALGNAVEIVIALDAAPQLGGPHYSARVQIQLPQITSIAIEIATHGQPTVNQVKPTPTAIAPIAASLAGRRIA